MVEVSAPGAPAGTPGTFGNELPLVAALHLRPKPGNVPGNLRLAERTLTAAKRAHPALRWAVLPERLTTGYAGLRAVHRYAEDAEGGPNATFFASLARRLGLYIAYGFPKRRRSGGVSDSANLVGPLGLLLTYRKRRLVWTTDEPGVFFRAARSRSSARAARSSLSSSAGTPAPPRPSARPRSRARSSSSFPAGWRRPWGRQYELACAARALDNAIYLASANQLGEYPEAGFDTPGGVYGPKFL